NDTFGHLEGDRALVQAAEVLRRTFRNSDIVARLGGDEFVALAIDTQDDRSVLLQRLQEQLQACNARSDRGYELSFSVGGARYPADGIGSLDDLLTRADAALYEHKRSRRHSGHTTPRPHSLGAVAAVAAKAP